MKKLQTLLIVIVMILTLGILTSNVYAVGREDSTTSMELNIKYDRPFKNKNAQYEIKHNGDHKIFKIGEKISNDLSFKKTLYCLRFGLGFGTTTADEQGDDLTYTKLANLKTEKDGVIAYYKSINATNIDIQQSQSVNGQSYNFTPYNSILWLVDNICLLEEGKITEDTTPKDIPEIMNMLKKANITNDKLINALTINDIDVIQQCALWYFSNYGESDDNSFLNNENPINNALTINENGSNPLDSSDARKTAIESLYNYLIHEAIKNGAKAPTQNTTTPTVSFAPTTPNVPSVTEKTFSINSGRSANYYVVGPFKINKQNAEGWNITLTPTFGYKSATTASDYQNVNSLLYITTINNQVVDEGGYHNNINDVGDEQFYVAINKTNITGSIVDCKFSVAYSYNGKTETTATLWTNTSKDEQPVLLLEKEPLSGNGTIEKTVDNKKIDFSLRKYITKVESNGKITEYETRKPRVDTLNLKNGGTTATYTHAKKPVEVKNDDFVFYTIEVYNEGNVDGKVTEIKDYLPEGLHYEGIETEDYKGTIEEDGRTLKITYNGNKELKAFAGGDSLESAKVVVKCKVEAKAGPKDQILTNVAEITGYVANGKTDGDIDSSKTFSNPLNLDTYYGKNHTSYTINDAGTYYEGQEDDDDFEKIIIKGVYADFALRKYITSIKRGEDEVLDQTLIQSRTPEIVESYISTIEQTAHYKHSKAPIEVEKDDIITYTIAVYNEGTVSGKVTEIIDHLPEGITFNKEETNKLAAGKYTCASAGNKLTITLTENYKLNAFTGTGELDKKEIKIVCDVTAQKTNERQMFTNIAEISAYEVDAVGVSDRDNKASFPENILSNPADYNGKEIKDTNYYVGQEDDDDFEKVYMKGVEADFALRKYITKVERNGENVEITSREPKINTAPLMPSKVLGRDITAIYAHMKTPVEVKPEDKITYTIAVYNEGKVDGKVTKIVDYLPEGIVFDPASNPEFVQEGQNIEGKKYSYKVEGNKLTITYLKDYNLTAFAGKDLASEKIQIVCKVEAKQTDKDQVLTNIAEILEYSLVGVDKKVVDRDSEPNTIKDSENVSTYYGHEGQDATTPGETNSESYYKGQQDDDDFEKVIIKGVNVDFALRKYITKVERDGQNIEIASRTPVVDPSSIASTKTATYKHLKAPVEVKTGDKITYAITVYNEGNVDGKVTKIVDYLPAGIEFDPASNPDFIQEGTENTAGKKYSYKVEGNKLTITYLEDYNLKAFTGGNLASKEIQIVCKVKALQTDKDQVLTNIAEILAYEVDAKDVQDWDSTPDTIKKDKKIDLSNITDYYGHEGQTSANPGETNSESYYVGREDDDDFEKVIIKAVNFDLSLRKFISSIQRNGEEVLKEDESREPIVDTSTLADSTTASYTHPKDPVLVKNGDIVTYTIRVYNEGDIPAYVNKITDHIPQGMEFIVDSEVNTKYRWQYESADDIDLISTDYWSKERTDAEHVDGLIPPYNGGDKLEYRDVEIQFKVVVPNTYEGELINIAEITDSVAVNDNNEELKIEDRDSKNPVNEEEYDIKPAPENSTYQEDDDDYERVQLKYFDLSLRKFITAIGDKEITERIPEVSYNEEEGKLEYNHPKTPIEVVNSDLITYTIRVYNEGRIAGYAELISDDIPVGLVFLPNNRTNVDYGWVMIDENGDETSDPKEAVRLQTAYLSETNGKEMMGEEDTVNPNLINPFNAHAPVSAEEPLNPDYRDVKIVFQVDQTGIPDDRIVTNHAQISEDSDDDEDSTPDIWSEPEDDQDIEKVHVKKFDLSLQKWVSQTIVTVDGETTTTETGFEPNVGHTEQEGRPNTGNEPLAQVVIDKKKLNKTVIKFVYKIRVSNEGELEGYATEITDYIPQGLAFVEEDNPLWTKVGEDKITTNALETVLLEPGDSAILDVVFTWINDENNLGTKKNIAAITEDYNEYGDTPDIDSTPEDINTPEYEKEQEDDDDYALVVLTLKTGGESSYIVLALVILAIISTGVLFIKRYVL